MALLDFDDLLLHTAAAIENDAAVAEEFRDRYRCFVVDEYQDVTPLQQRVLNAWLGDRDDLTVVGDANQTIYSFTGATPRYLLDFSRRFPDAAVVRLERDYRSTPQVVSLANRVIAAARGRVAGSKLHLVGQRDAGPAPSFAEHPDEVAEAAAVAKKITQLIESGTPPSEIAVLYRINAQSEVYEEALTEAGVAFQVRGGEGFFSRQEIRQALLALQRAAERGADASAAELPPLVRELLEPLGLTAEAPSGTRARERWEALTALAELVDDEVAQRPSARSACAAGRASAARRCASPTGRAGRHAGLAARRQGSGMGRGVPGRPGRRHAAHLARVGPWPRQRAGRRGTSPALCRNHQGPSAFGAQLGAVPKPGWSDRVDGRHASSTASRRTRRPTRPNRPRKPRGPTPRCRVCNNTLTTPAAVMLRRCESCPSDIDEELLADLKDWRLRTSKDMSVPAYVVFTDNTLIAIAETLPTDDAALVAIPGIGARKLEQFGPDVLAMVKGRQTS